jgi:hypothetical protein
VSYTPPTGWSKVEKPGCRTYTTVDRTNQTYGLIAIFASAPSSGNGPKDFTLTWNTLVKQPFSTGITPVPSIARSKEGYEGYQGTTFGKSSGKPTTVTLVNYTGGGKTISIVLNYNDIKCENVFYKFIESIKLPAITSGN